MSHPTTDSTTFVHTVAQAMTDIAQTLYDRVVHDPQALADMERTILDQMKPVAAMLLTGLCAAAVPRYAEPHVSCPHCDGTATYQRHRTVEIITLFGPITYTRPYYLCPTCRQGHCPMDATLGACAGGISAELEELCACLGFCTTFEEASTILSTLSLVTVSPTTIRTATERVGHVLEEHEDTAVAHAFDIQHPIIPSPPPDVPETLYISMDGNLVNIRTEQWKENKLGAVYTTTTTQSPTKPGEIEIRATDISYVSDFTDSHTFGKLLWLESARRGSTEADTVVVIGDGAAWIWTLAEEHYPDAVQILDWYHVTEYVWAAANACYGTGTDLAKGWAKKQLDRLWDGEVETVIAELRNHMMRGDAVTNAISYFTNNRTRMDYPCYRARGLQIGSGTIESGCKHVIAQRLKQAGMIWNKKNARAMAKGRAWLKSGRWNEAMALRPRYRRTYQRRPSSLSDAQSAAVA